MAREEISLKSRFKVIIPAFSSRPIMTNIHIHQNYKFTARKIEISAKIKSNWLTEAFKNFLVIKTGLISPCYAGDVILCAFNRGPNDIIIQKMQPVATLISCKYEYD